MQKAILYYTDNRLDPAIMQACQRQIEKSGLPVYSVSLEPIEFGNNYVLGGYPEPGPAAMFHQILRGLQMIQEEIVFFCEHDVLYHPSHFEFTPERQDVYYYNLNVWKVRTSDWHAVKVDFCQQTSGLCAYRKLLLEHYYKRVALVYHNGYSSKMGFEPGTHNRPERVDDYKAESWSSPFPNLDLRHGKNLTPSRWKPEQFRNKRFTAGWKEADEVVGWGRLSDVLAPAGPGVASTDWRGV